MLHTPVLFLVFNRPAETLLVFEQIRQQQPAQLFIAADGPRLNKPEEKRLCDETRQLIMDGIDWPCDVKTQFRQNNLGCGKAVSTAIDWFFEHVEEGIILEDDCLSDPTFFSFCSELLSRYRWNESIMHIGGSNFQLGNQRGKASYYFSHHVHVWGWATWRRAWKKYDFSLVSYQHFLENDNNQRLPLYLQAIYNSHPDTWDIQWSIVVWFNNGWGITPNTSLIRNIGYGKSATHTKRMPLWFKKMNYGAIPVIIHPTENRIDKTADKFTGDMMLDVDSLSAKIKNIIKKNAVLYKLYKRISI
ncbi:hypothetical protein CLV51_102165 [Chitinophaga niastensis]|uniref:Nucleotide-diphospho-sugar transferase n=1 Tax=Chitinophaga niastensis TaxID=536980 RepID=A0A2P8HM83_CHINA|nr:hypothetical protein [Chitinophaga niastensis]PSL47319.1 hypothetical protein CLV51_102165 [Chitinophaga niastensis]